MWGTAFAPYLQIKKDSLVQQASPDDLFLTVSNSSTTLPAHYTLVLQLQLRS